jgi:hypothetical protein
MHLKPRFDRRAVRSMHQVFAYVIVITQICLVAAYIITLYVLAVVQKAIESNLSRIAAE